MHPMTHLIVLKHGTWGSRSTCWPKRTWPRRWKLEIVGINGEFVRSLFFQLHTHPYGVSSLYIKESQLEYSYSSKHWSWVGVNRFKSYCACQQKEISQFDTKICKFHLRQNIYIQRKFLNCFNEMTIIQEY